MCNRATENPVLAKRMSYSMRSRAGVEFSESGWLKQSKRGVRGTHDEGAS